MGERARKTVRTITATARQTYRTTRRASSAARREAVEFLNNHLSKCIPHPQACQIAALKLAEQHPNFSREDLAKVALRSARRWGSAAGAATGAVSNPLAMIPAALTDMAAMLRIEAALAGTVGAIMDPESLTDLNLYQTDVLAIIFPAAASQALRQVAIRAGEQATKAAIRKYASEDFLKLATRYAGLYLGKELSGKALTKSVPLVGAGIGAVWNWMEVGKIGQRAVLYHSGRSVGKRLPGPRPPTASLDS